MAEVSPKNIVDKALQLQQLEKMLLGEPEFRYLPPTSPSPWNTDIVELLAVLYDSDTTLSRQDLKDQLCGAIQNVAQSYDGLVPAAICILFESIRQRDRHHAFDLPLESLARELQREIDKRQLELRRDKRGPGSQWPDGLLGELRTLSNNTKEVGGPSFVE